MKKKFSINQISEKNESHFDRQQRISWWRQEVLQKAKIMVVGAGAIGNETLKNLALLGVGQIFIVDFDQISTSNLSRTVLFRKSDLGKTKSEIAAQRTLELCLHEQPKIDWFHGDAVWELGAGVFRSMDIVLGCLDNVETRFAINRQCRLAGVPWIDTGIAELRCRVNVYGATGPCYECSMTREQYKARRIRYSCDVFKKRMVAEGKVPTVQITSAWVSAIQVQETIKLLHGQYEGVGKMIYYEGKTNEFDLFQLTENHECEAHVEYPEVTPLALNSKISLGTFLWHVSEHYFQGKPVWLDFRGERSFVKSVACRSRDCNTPVYFYKPSFHLFDDELYCINCKGKEKISKSLIEDDTPNMVLLGEFNMAETEEQILKMSLRNLGVPLWHIVAVRNEVGEYKYFELEGDKPLLLPNFYKE